MKRVLFLLSFFLTIGVGIVTAQETGASKCHDNLDNDGDGLIDCLDSECGCAVTEIPDNGIDDDGDHFIDCYDKEILNTSACNGFFLGTLDECSVTPTTFPPFEMKLKFKSDPKTTNHINRLLVGDVENDGKPEIVTTYRNADNGGNNTTQSVINILQAPPSGGTLTVDKQIDMFPKGYYATFEDIAMADIDRDGCAEYFVMINSSDGTNYRIVSYNCKGVEVWASPITFTSYPGTMGLVDFDHDGLVELYCRTQIYDAHTGKFFGENNIDNDNTGINAGVNKGRGMNASQSVAVDIDGNGTMELVDGCRIYSVVINRAGSSATLTLTKQRPEYATRTSRTTGSNTSVADFNQDGFLDVLAVGSINAYDDNTTIFFWDVKNDVLKTFSDQFLFNVPNTATPITTDSLVNTDYQKGWKNGAGRINIADIDGDTLMNAVYVSGKYLYALKEGPTSLQLLWKELVTEETSGYTGCTMFDFNADGKSEIVYRDEDYIYIFTTQPDGTVVKSLPVRCASRTSNEYPIVADMDGDGSTEICVTCAVDETVLGKKHSLFDDAEVRVYESANVPWVPARKVWNQHGYFVVNVNDDLTIPKFQQLHHLTYAETAQCRKGGKSRPLNSFLNQSPFLDNYGCPSFATPNLAFGKYDPSGGIDIQVTPPTCPQKDFTVSFKFKNLGDISLSGDLPVSFYNGDPNAVGATRLGTMKISLASLNPGDSLTQLNAKVTGPGTSFKLYIVLNDDGSTVPTPIHLPNSGIVECDYGDNVRSVDVNTLPAPIVPELIRNNLVCSAIPGVPPPPNDGAVKAYVPIGTLKDSVNFNFYWSDGTVAKPLGSEDHIGHIYSGLAAGTYTVYAIHKTVACGSVPASIDVSSSSVTVNVTITKDRDSDNCKNPNGKLTALVDSNGDGVPEPNGNFIFTWYEGALAGVGDTLGVSHTLTSLAPGVYSLIVYDKATGCRDIDSKDILDLSKPIVVDTSHVDIICSNAKSGSALATVDDPSKYFINWYNGNTVKPSADFVGAAYNNLGQGTYTVVVVDKNTQCESPPLTVKIKQTKAPSPINTTKTDQVSCSALASDLTGSATADVGGTTVGYNFTWFDGQNTLPVNQHAVNTATINNLQPGFYTVLAEDQNTHCTSTAQVQILNKATPPTLTLTHTDMLHCQPFDGSVTATPSSGALADYTFTWYNGQSVKATSDYPAVTGNVLSNLKFGFYTVAAFNNKTKCQTLAKTDEVKNLTPSINIVVVPNPAKYPRDCASSDGEITATITGNPGGFNVEWFKATNPPPLTPRVSEQSRHLSGSPITDNLTGQSTGYYTIVVTNDDDHCQDSKDYFLPTKASDSLHVVQTDVTKCTPVDGTITAELIFKPDNIALGISENDYIIDLYKFNNSTPIATVTGTANGSPVFNFTGLDSGKYYVRAIANPASPIAASICTVFSDMYEIDLNIVQPTLSLNTTDNTNCAAGAANGTVTAVGSGPAALNYEFFTGNNNTTLADRLQNGASTTLTGKLGGFYTVRLTAGNGCQIFTSAFVATDTAMMSSTLASSPLTLCGGPPYDGQINLTNITETDNNGSTTNPFGAPYTVAWFNAAGSSIADPMPPPNVLEALDSGAYHAQVTNTTTGCKTSLIRAHVDDAREYPTIDLTSFVDPTSCLKVPVGSDPDVDPATNQRVGRLTIAPAGNNGPFTINWFVGSPKTGGSIGNTTTLTNITAAGTFTVEVTSTKNCVKSDAYTIPLDNIPVTLDASAAAVTDCLSPDGRLSAIVSSAGFGATGRFSEYDYTWHQGTDATGPTVYNTRFASTAIDASWTVLAIDKMYPTCQVTATVVVENGRVYPVVTAGVLNPRTMCDSSHPDGIAFAAVGNNEVDFTFDWYGEPMSGAPFATGPQVGNLTDSIYNVVATNSVTHCSDTTDVTIEFSPAAVPNPEITILSQVTNCDPNNPNGALTVAVGGNTTDYLFKWYDGSVKKDSSDYYDEVIIDSLKAGSYSVVAVDRTTLCVSPLKSETIFYRPVFPTFDIDVEPTLCGLETGIIFLTITNSVDIAQMDWYHENVLVAQGPVVQNAGNGTYTVFMTTAAGCDTTASVNVLNEINPYNGISRNGDALNNYFHINCIEDFPSNIVKIWNRAGTLVYEGKGYDNAATLFDGVSNRGVSPMGNNLPDGTYFYIIDKRDGSKPIAGYLEIVN